MEYLYLNFTDILEISMNILTKILVRQKLFKIYKNIQKNLKNDKINKNTYVKVFFLKIIDIDMIKQKNIDK